MSDLNYTQRVVRDVIAACVSDIIATLEINDDPAVRYELGVAAESLIVQVAPAFDVEPDAIREALDSMAI